MSNGTVDSTATGTTGGGLGLSGFENLLGQKMGTESSLSQWAGPYVTEMLGMGRAAATAPYQAYTGPLTAGSSGLQNQAWQGLAGLTIPTGDQTTFTAGTYTAPGVAQQYMNPFVQTALNPQIEEARRQSEIENLKNKAAATRAGAYGGSRQALMESENQRNLLQNLALITGKGYETAYNKGAEQFNTEQGRQQAAVDAARKYGLESLAAQGTAGATQRDIEQQGIAADMAQFQEQRDFPFKQAQYMQSLLQNLPLETQSIQYSQPSAVGQALGAGSSIMEMYNQLFGNKTAAPTGTTPPKA